MDCLLMRHGIAVDPEAWDGAEEDRPLTKKGKARVRQAAAGLATLTCAPTHLFSSPCVRAYDTAKLLCTEVCPALDVEICQELVAGVAAEPFFSFLRSLPSESTVICVGHEPLLGDVAGMLLSGHSIPGLWFKKAGAALIHLPDGPKPGRGILRWWLQPKQLRILGLLGRKH